MSAAPSPRQNGSWPGEGAGAGPGMPPCSGAAAGAAVSIPAGTGAIGLSGFRLSLTQCFSSVLATTIDCSSGQRGSSYSSMTECGLFW